MREQESFQNVQALVLGLGRFGGGVAVTRWLVEQGAAVSVSDRASRDSLAASLEAIADLNVRVHLGAHDFDQLGGADLVVVNPAVVKSRSRFFQEIIRREIPWTTEMNLFCERCPATVVGVTGSFGKSTTCAMLAVAARASLAKDVERHDAPSAKRETPDSVVESATARGAIVNEEPGFANVHLGGNIGRSLLPELPRIGSRDLVVLELSSAQLEDLPRIKWTPPIAVITNLFPHHLDRYATPADYYAAKFNIITRSGRTDRSQTEDGWTRPDRTDATWTRSGVGLPKLIVGAMHAEAEALLARVVSDGLCEVVPVRRLDPDMKLRSPGDHNRTNAACVLTTCAALGLDESAVRDAVCRFGGLPHRLEFVRTVAGVDYINDSKSTSPAATVAAIGSLDRPVVAIVGGQRKHAAWESCVATLATRCRYVVCFGEAGAAVARLLLTAPGESRPILKTVGSLPQAVSAAHAVAVAGDAVLFSPGAPSFDAYNNFVERGCHFSAIVSKL